MEENKEINKKDEEAPLQKKKSDEFQEIDIGNNDNEEEEDKVKKGMVDFM